MASIFSSFRQRLIAFILLGFLALLGIVGMSIWLGYTSQINFENALLARDIRAAASELRNGLQAAESSQRGFLLTKNEIYLAPFGAAKISTMRQLEKLKSLMVSDSNMQPAMQKLSGIISEKLSDLEKTIALKRVGDDKATLAVMASNVGKRLMDEANLFINAIIQQADTRLTDSVTEERSVGALLRVVSLLSAFTIFAIGGAIWLMISRNNRDLTDMHDKVLEVNSTLEQRVLHRTARLAEANQEIQRFAYIVTHDLRAPLVNILGFTSELERSVAMLRPFAAREANGPVPSVDEVRLAIEQDIPEAVGFIRSSTKKMDVLIGAILQLARVGQRQLRPETIDLQELIKEALTTLQFQLTEVGGNFTADLSVTHISSDRIALTQIFSNLFDNAIKYRSETRPLLIKVSSRSGATDEIILEVIDNGRGIAGHDKERIFEMFRRSGEMNQQGEGIGLYYVRSLLRKLGGDIQVDSVLGSGTVFSINLPTTLHISESTAT